MISAPCSRAASTNFFTFGTESAQRLRRSGVQVCTVKSITRGAVSFGTRVTGLSCGGGGSFTWLQSSMTVWARAGFATNSAAATAIAIEMDLRPMNSSLGFLQAYAAAPDGATPRAHPAAFRPLPALRELWFATDV